MPMSDVNQHALVLDCHRAALEAVQSLGRAGVRSDIIARDGADGACLAYRSKYVDRKLVHNFVSDLSGCLRALDAERHYRLVIPSTDLGLLQILRLEEKDDLRRRCVVASNSALEVALHKAATLALAIQLGIPVPRGHKVSGSGDGPSDIGFPRVLKPIRSRVFADGAAKALAPVIVSSVEERDRVLERLLPYSEVIEQEYVGGIGVGIELLFENGRMLWNFAHERIHELPLTGGASTYRRSIAVPSMALDFSVALLQALRWHGVAMVEFKRTADGRFVLMEINPRLWGSLALSIDAGVDFPRGLLAIAEGEAVSAQPRYKLGYSTRAMPDDIVWMGVNLYADHDQKLLLTRPRIRSFIEYLKVFIGKESWDHFTVRDPVVFKEVVQNSLSLIFQRARKVTHGLMVREKLKRQHKSLVRNHRLTRNSNLRLLFVCYGNICRSPFAAALASSLMPEVLISSAGFNPKEYRRPPAHVCAVAREFGITLDGHKSRSLKELDCQQADLILVMDGENFDALMREMPQAARRATALGFFSADPHRNIEDPYDMSIEQSRSVFARIQSAVHGLALWLDNERRTQQRSAKMRGESFHS